MSMLKARMEWHQARQKVLAENVANADTPGFKPSDLKEPAFARDGRPIGGTMAAARTSPAHLAGLPALPGGDPDAARRFETTPSGNAVSLEEEMLKSTQNQSDFQLAASLYTKSLQILRVAVGRRG